MLGGCLLRVIFIPQPKITMNGQCAGHLGHQTGIYVACELDNVLVCALIDTGSTIFLLLGGVLKSRAQKHQCRKPGPNICTVSGNQLLLEVSHTVQGRLGMSEVVVGQIITDCILGLDFLQQYGAIVDLVAVVLRGSFGKVKLN